MSEATLKRKTQHKYKNNSVSSGQFSINGIRRNQGFVGQTSLCRTTDFCCRPETNEVKSSVLSFKGMIQKRTQWARRPAPYSSVKAVDTMNKKVASDYIQHIRNNTLKMERELLQNKTCGESTSFCCKEHKGLFSIHVPRIAKPAKVQTQHDYVLNMKKECTEFPTYETNHKTCSVCGCKNC